jgi:hypothetical protein
MSVCFLATGLAPTGKGRGRAVIIVAVRIFAAIVVCLFCAAGLRAQTLGEGTPAPNPTDPVVKPTVRAKPAGPQIESDEQGIAWKGLLAQSGFFLSLQHAFRLATEPGTRSGMKGPFFGGYADALGSLHGWSDGDPFYVNYIGHPMQGAVAGFIFAHNDRSYRRVEFGKNRDYWLGRLRAGAYAYVYSLQFEIGPISEASIGKVQRDYPQQGFVDQAITPTIGIGWMVMEDAIDKYIVRRLEGRYRNAYLRGFLRGALNPAHTFANGMAFKSPWYRDNRPSVWNYDPKTFSVPPVRRPPPDATPGVAPFEFDVTFRAEKFLSYSGYCLGGGGTGALRLSPSWQLIGDMSGCNLMGLPKNVSGDSFTFTAGPRWTPVTSGRWIPHLQVLVGANKMTEEIEDPIKKALYQLNPPTSDAPVRPDYLIYREASGFALAAGGGIDYRVNRAIQLRVARFDYRRSWVPTVNGRDYSQGLQFTTGLVVRMGNW